MSLFRCHHSPFLFRFITVASRLHYFCSTSSALASISSLYVSRDTINVGANGANAARYNLMSVSSSLASSTFLGLLTASFYFHILSLIFDYLCSASQRSPDHTRELADRLGNSCRRNRMVHRQQRAPPDTAQHTKLSFPSYS